VFDNQGSAGHTMNQQIAVGATVYDAAGEKVGTVRAYDAQGGYLDVEKGWLFPKDVSIPLRAVQSTAADGDVQLNLYKDDLQGDQYVSPPTGGATTPARYDQGVGAADATTTATTTARDQAQAQAVRGDEEIAVPVREEELAVGKRAREEGRVHLHKDVVAEQQTVNVPLTQERVTVERVPVAGQADVNTADAFQERDIDVPVRGEEAVVGKQVHATEEVRLHKEVATEQQQVSDTVRKERVTIEGTDDGGPDDRTTTR